MKQFEFKFRRKWKNRLCFGGKCIK